MLRPELSMEVAQRLDTVVTVLARDGLETAAQISLVVLGVTLLALLAALVILLGQIRGLSRAARALGTRALDRSGPLMDRGKAVVDNVEFITRAVRSDVERLNASVKALTDRLHQASDRMEERIEEFNALMEVVQSEAEAVFVETASTVRGVQASARSLADAPPTVVVTSPSPMAEEEAGLDPDRTGSGDRTAATSTEGSVGGAGSEAPARSRVGGEPPPSDADPEPEAGTPEARRPQP